MTPWKAFVVGIAATFAVLLVGVIIYSSQSDSTLYACSDGRPLPVEYQRDESGDLPEDSDFWFFAWYEGDWSEGQRMSRCADHLVNQWVRVLACSVIEQIDGEEDESGVSVLERAWEADADRSERGAGARPDATTFPMRLLPEWSYLLRFNENEGDGWGDLKAEDLRVVYDWEGAEASLGSLCFSQYGDFRVPSPE